MRPSAAPVLLLLMMFAARLAGFDPGESQQRFLDVRLQAGLERGFSEIDDEDARGQPSLAGAVTLMYGDIGSARPHEAENDWQEWMDDLGFVLGGRAAAVHWTGDPGRDSGRRVSRESFGLAVVGGLAWRWNDSVHLELCGLYGVGVSSTGKAIEGEFERSGAMRWYGVEAGTYYTWRNNLQTGLTLGYDQARFDAPLGASGDDVAWRAGGVDAYASLGYRF
jgi:hypothetical protein